MAPRTFNADDYEFKDYMPTYPKIDYPPHEEFKLVDRGTFADPEMKALLSAATKRDDMTPVLGTELEGIDLRQLSDKQKDELTLLAAQRGVLVFRNQEASIYDLVELAKYYGPPHYHSTTGVPSDPALAAVHVVFNDGTKAPDRLALRKGGWHSDQTYEINTPGFTSLKVITAPPTGGDTIWCSGYAVYSSFSREFQKYLETLYALHSSDVQKQQTIDRGTYIRRPQTDCIHPVVRVHPATGMKSIYINRSYTRRIVGIPKAESDAMMAFILNQVEVQNEHQLRVRWGVNDIVMWDNRCTWHTATPDSVYPHKRHALRATPLGERPISVEDYEKATGKKAKDWYVERMKTLGEDVEEEPKNVAKAGGAD